MKDRYYIDEKLSSEFGIITVVDRVCHNPEYPNFIPEDRDGVVRVCQFHIRHLSLYRELQTDLCYLLNTSNLHPYYTKTKQYICQICHGDVSWSYNMDRLYNDVFHGKCDGCGRLIHPKEIY